jgi:hypothetical protein
MGSPRAHLARCAANRPWECCWSSSSCYCRPADLQRPTPARQMRTAYIVAAAMDIVEDRVIVIVVFRLEEDVRDRRVPTHRSASLERTVHLEVE